MKEKADRFAAIRKLIAQQEISAQEELLRLLHDEGFELTQATLSRDLKALGACKILNKSGNYIYSLPEPEALANFRERLKDDLLRGFVSLVFSGNLGIIKTHPGYASAVAYALDNLGIEEILGTIAGDDTVLVIPFDGLKRERISKGITKKIPELKEKLNL